MFPVELTHELRHRVPSKLKNRTYRKICHLLIKCARGVSLSKRQVIKIMNLGNASVEIPTYVACYKVDK